MNLYLALGYNKKSNHIEVFGFDFEKDKLENKFGEILKLERFKDVEKTFIAQIEEENNITNIGQQIGDWLHDVIGIAEDEVQETIDNIRNSFNEAMLALQVAPSFLTTFWWN